MLLLRSYICKPSWQTVRKVWHSAKMQTAQSNTSEGLARPYLVRRSTGIVCSRSIPLARTCAHAENTCTVGRETRRLRNRKYQSQVTGKQQRALAIHTLLYVSSFLTYVSCLSLHSSLWLSLLVELRSFFLLASFCFVYVTSYSASSW
jgi:hypothetical protein